MIKCWTEMCPSWVTKPESQDEPANILMPKKLKRYCSWCLAEQKKDPPQGATFGICHKHKQRMLDELHSMSLSEKIKHEKERRGEL